MVRLPSRRLALTSRAEVGRTTAEPDRADCRSAYAAWQPFATIDKAVELEGAGRSVAVDIIPQCAAPPGDRFGERLAHGFAQSPQTLSRDPVGDARWADTGAKQRLVGVDVANAHDDAVVHQSELDRCFALARGPKQVVGIEIGAERLGPEPSQQWVHGTGRPQHGAEASRVVIAQHDAIAELKVDVVVGESWRGVLVNAQTAGHAEMDEQRIRIQPE